jgi:hypothetical protein
MKLTKLPNGTYIDARTILKISKSTMVMGGHCFHTLDISHNDGTEFLMFDDSKQASEVARELSEYANSV